MNKIHHKIKLHIWLFIQFTNIKSVSSAAQLVRLEILWAFVLSYDIILQPATFKARNLDKQ